MSILSSSNIWLLFIRTLIFIGAAGLLSELERAVAQAQTQDEKIEVKSYMDTSSAGWAYKESDYAFVVEKDGCRIQWNAVEMKGPGHKRSIAVRRDCSIPFSQQVPIHKAILKEISSRWPISEFDTISWGGFGYSSDWSWSIPIAVASSKSKEYRLYRSGRSPSTPGINGIFVKLANETNAYRELKQLIQEFGADIELLNVEKVFTSTAGDLPFYPALKDSGIHSRDRLIYDVAFSYFRIK